MKNRNALVLSIICLILTGCGGPDKTEIQEITAADAQSATEVSLLPSAGTPSAGLTPAVPPPPGIAPAGVPANIEQPGVSDPKAPNFDSASPNYDPKLPDQIVAQITGALQQCNVDRMGTPQGNIAPKTLQELVKLGYLRKVPVPPPGKKIVYVPDNWEVRVEDIK